MRLFFILVQSLVLVLSIVGCSKKRPTQLDEVQQETIFSKSDFHQVTLWMQTNTSANKYYASSGEEVEKYEVVQVNASAPLQKIFRNLQVEGKSNQSMPALTVLRSDNKLIAYKLVTENDFNSLSQYEKSLSQPSPAHIAHLGKFQVELFNYPVEKYGVLEKVKNDLGEETNKFRLRETSFEEATHCQINLNATKTFPEARTSKDLEKYDPEKIITVDDFRGKEFLYRRTLVDSPNLFGSTFSGTSGDMEIVKFHFKKDVLEIKRSGALLVKDGVNSLDEETLLSFPATYYRARTQDEHGNPLTSVEYIQAKPEDKRIVAVIDWSQNSIPNISSPLSFFSLEKCFSGAKGKEVSEIDQRNSTVSGVPTIFNFSLSTTYSSSSDLGCVNTDHSSLMQTTFTFKERLSFKEYKESERGDEKPLLDLPFSAQKKLGFGLFTSEKLVPTELGVTGIKGTMKPLPALFDLKNGKSVTYVLAGIPSEQENANLRGKLIVATKEVIRDLNEAFKKAFRRTPQERAEDVVLLKVEGLNAEEEQRYGLSSVERRHMGDLDTNYIYYIPKATDFGIIGLGGPHQNPRSGKIEAASVFIYGGNMKMAVADFKLRNKVEEEYLNNLKGSSSSTSGTSGTSGSRIGSISRSVLHKNFSEAIEKDHSGLDQFWDDLKRNFPPLVKNNSLNLNSPEYTTLMPEASRDFYLKFQKAVSEKALHDQLKMAAIFDGKIIDGKVVENPQGKNLYGIIKELEKKGLCVLQSGEEAIDPDHSGGNLNLTKASDEDILIAMYRPTLAHELGHNFGLRHNFLGSYDFENFYSSPEEKLENDKRPYPKLYSSVMDYLADDHYSYAGYGPYDIHALRAAYTGHLLLNSPKTSLISLDEIKRRAGIESWHDLTLQQIRNIDLKEFNFCTDEDVGVIPVCDRHDLGTKPLDIVASSIRNYKMFYDLTNIRGNRIKFNRDAGNYIARVIRIFQKLRQFLEEGLYLSYTLGSYPSGSEQENARALATEYLFATFQGYEFLKEVVRTPDTSSLNSPDEANSRFETVKGTSVTGKELEMVVERKWPYDIDRDQSDGRDFREIKVRGVQLDKTLALLFLTGDQAGLEKYRYKDSLVFSFFEFEKRFLPVFEMAYYKRPRGPVNRKNSPLLNLMTEVLTDRIEPMTIILEQIKIFDGNTVTVPSRQYLSSYYKASASHLMKSIATQGIMIGLNSSDSMNLEDDPSSGFRVFSKTLPPTGINFITQMDAKQGEKFWTNEEAVFTHQMIKQSSAMNSLVELFPTLAADFQAYSEARYDQVEASEVGGENQEKADKLVKDLETKIIENFKKLPAEVFAVSGNPMNLQTMDQMSKMILQEAFLLEKKLMENKSAQEEKNYEKSVERSKNRVEFLCKKYPILFAYLLSFKPGDLSRTARRIWPNPAILAFQQGEIFQAVRQLSRLYNAVNPFSPQ